MTIENVELMHECSPKDSCMETARMKFDKETEEKGKNRRVNKERSTAGHKKNQIA